MLHILLYLAGVAALALGASVIASAPAVTQQMAGLILVLIAVNAIGFAEVIRHMQNAADELLKAVKTDKT